MRIFPHLQSRRIRLRPAGARDSIKLYELLLGLGLNTLPSPDDFVSAFGRGVTASFLVETPGGDFLGFCSLHGMSPAGHHVEGGIYMSPENSANGVGAEASLLMINYAFAMWNVRKVYFQTTEASLSAIGGDLKVSHKEGILSGHQYFSGQHWDVHVFAIYREEWDQFCAHAVERLVRDRPRAPAARRAPA
ncbi:GNAT family N-acetyltransferase [Nonomuraea sp. CA-218870]|uniref:GNAT family N-acetyltransferase n=1 Tax=Nonomuraea sp. CA-218870 TaxID=3239998 RepID=UPI003D901AD1